MGMCQSKISEKIKPKEKNLYLRLTRSKRNISICSMSQCLQLVSDRAKVCNYSLQVDAVFDDLLHLLTSLKLCHNNWNSQDTCYWFVLLWEVSCGHDRSLRDGGDILTVRAEDCNLCPAPWWDQLLQLSLSSVTATQLTCTNTPLSIHLWDQLYLHRTPLTNWNIGSHSYASCPQADRTYRVERRYFIITIYLMDWKL